MTKKQILTQIILLGLVFSALIENAQAQTAITNFIPSSGTVGSSISIIGSGFDLTPSNNLVLFGNVSATVNSSAPNMLDVTVPHGISGEAKITVINLATGYQFTSSNSFITTFNHGIATTATASNQFVSQASSASGPNLSGESVSNYSGEKMLVGDFDGDGKSDFATMGTSASNAISVFRNTISTSGTAISNSTFSAASVITLDANTVTTAGEAYDLNNDGKLDILLGRTNGFTVLENTSTGSGNIAFSKSTFSPTGTYASARVVAFDIDNDGDKDILALNSNGTTLSIYQNNSTMGTLAISSIPTNITLPKACADLNYSDMDGDGDIEPVILSNSSSGSALGVEDLFYFENTNSVSGVISVSTTTSVISSSIPSGNYSITAKMAIEDFDLDGDFDVVTATKGGFTQPSLVQIHRNDGSGNFSSFFISNFYTSSNITFKIRIADINGDGKRDIIFIKGNSGAYISAIMNSYSTGTLGAGDFSNHSNISASSFNSVGFGIADFNQDGKPDIISNQYFNSNLYYYTNGNALYYAKNSAATQLELLSSWSSTEDGTGSSPANFSSGTFVLNNTSNTSQFQINNNWTFSGTLEIPVGKTFYIPNNLTFNLIGSVDNSGFLYGDALSTLNLNSSNAMSIDADISVGSLTLGTSLPSLTLNGNDTIHSILRINSGKTLFLGSSCNLVVYDSINSTGTITASNGSNVNLIGTNTIYLSGTNQFYNLNLENSAGLVLNNNQTINGVLNIIDGKIKIGDNILTVAQFSGGSTSSYVQTNASGSVRSTISNGSTVNFLVGKSAFNPVEITNNTGTDDAFNVSVDDEVYNNGYSGNTVTDSRITRTWHISKDNPNDGSGVDFVFNWNNGEVSGSMSNPTLNHYDGTQWEVPTPSSSSSMSNSLTVIGYTGGFSPFAIGNGLTPLPIDVLDFNVKYNKTINSNVLTWILAGDAFNGKIEVLKSINGVNWLPISILSVDKELSALKKFSVDDANPKGINLYKLNLISNNEDQFYSNIVQIDNSSTVQIIGNVLPNPNAGTFVVEVNEPVEYSLFDLTGKLILKGQIDAHLLIENLDKGIYTLVLHNADNQINKKVVIQ
jgi:hypothetical protein